MSFDFNLVNGSVPNDWVESSPRPVDGEGLHLDSGEWVKLPANTLDGLDVDITITAKQKGTGSSSFYIILFNEDARTLVAAPKLGRYEKLTGYYSSGDNTSANTSHIAASTVNWNKAQSDFDVRVQYVDATKEFTITITNIDGTEYTTSGNLGANAPTSTNGRLAIKAFEPTYIKRVQTTGGVVIPDITSDTDFTFTGLEVEANITVPDLDVTTNTDYIFNALEVDADITVDNVTVTADGGHFGTLTCFNTLMGATTSDSSSDTDYTFTGLEVSVDVVSTDPAPIITGGEFGVLTCFHTLEAASASVQQDIGYTFNALEVTADLTRGNVSGELLVDYTFKPLEVTADITSTVPDISIGLDYTFKPLEFSVEVSVPVYVVTEADMDYTFKPLEASVDMRIIKTDYTITFDRKHKTIDTTQGRYIINTK